DRHGQALHAIRQRPMRHRRHGEHSRPQHAENRRRLRAAGKTIKTDAAQIKIFDSDATVWVSAVDDHDIATSKRLLITHLTDLQNTDMKYADIRRKVLLEWGHAPHIVQNGRAEITVKMQNPQNATVWRLRTDGERLSKLDATVTPDGLRIPLDIRGPHGAQLLYEVTVE
ncbi:MAG: hypothetical protein IKS67_00300, partial [Victivallales bacterium]|nr:hypothetical protein [Victivallales bacterium]